MRTKSALILLLTIAIITTYSAPSQIKKFELSNSNNVLVLEKPEEPEPNVVNLKPLLDKYMALVDMEALEEFLLAKVAVEDPDMLKYVTYMQGEDAEAITKFLWENLAFVQHIKWLKDNGLTNIYNEINKLHALFGWKLISPSTIFVQRPPGPPTIPRNPHPAVAVAVNPKPRSLSNLLEEFLDLIPVNQFVDLTLELFTRQDESFMAFYLQMRLPDKASFWVQLKQLDEVQELFDSLRAEGVDIDSILVIIESIFSWGRESKAERSHRGHGFDLGPALGSVLEVIDVHGLKGFLKDSQFTPCGGKVLDYLRGQDFDRFVRDFYSEKAFRMVLNWIHSHGLHKLYSFISQLHAQLGIAPPPYPKHEEPDNSTCTPEQWTDLRTQLATFIPQDRLGQVTYELISRDESVQELMKMLASGRVEAAYLRLKKTGSVTVLLEKIRGAGFQVDKLVTLVEALFGWDNRPRK